MSSRIVFYWIGLNAEILAAKLIWWAQTLSGEKFTKLTGGSMRYFIFSILLLVFFSLSVMSGEIKLGETSPDFKLKAADGKEYQLSDLKEKSWCWSG